VLIPNERPHIVCQISQGFLIVSSRRILSVHEQGKKGYNVSKSVPFDAITGYDSLMRTFEIIEPRRISGESKANVREYLESTLSRCVEVIDELRDPEKVRAGLTSRTLSYLGDFPKCLTQDALLDLNTVIEDQPIDDNLVARASNFLGTDPIFIEETLRDSEHKESGILLAAGKKGFFWVRGQKQGRFLTNVVVDTVEWSNIQVLESWWKNDSCLIVVTYSLVEGGKPITMEYQWVPPINDETLRVPWFIQSSNGPYIFEDIMYKYTGRTMSPATDIQSR
jgi:hypothetical protein